MKVSVGTAPSWQLAAMCAPSLFSQLTLIHLLRPRLTGMLGRCWPGLCLCISCAWTGLTALGEEMNGFPSRMRNSAPPESLLYNTSDVQCHDLLAMRFPKGKTGVLVTLDLWHQARQLSKAFATRVLSKEVLRTCSRQDSGLTCFLWVSFFLLLA